MAEWHGFLPPADCTRCGTPLQGQGSGRPAELYAGTYTGLCYGCERAPSQIVGQWSDGAVAVEHPPHCPAYRRDRECYYAFPECLECLGTGCTWVKGAALFSGRSPRQCRACEGRRYGASTRYRARMREIEARVEQLERDATRLCKGLLRNEGWLPHWVSHPVAVEYRTLVKEVWETPVVREPHPTLSAAAPTRHFP